MNEGGIPSLPAMSTKDNVEELRQKWQRLVQEEKAARANVDEALRLWNEAILNAEYAGRELEELQHELYRDFIVDLHT